VSFGMRAGSWAARATREMGCTAGNSPGELKFGRSKNRGHGGVVGGRSRIRKFGRKATFDAAQPNRRVEFLGHGGSCMLLKQRLGCA
jgi:hypothetical protein